MITRRALKLLLLSMGLEIRCSKTSNSALTRVSESFPDLIQRKAGSPANGGGTWIHPLLALQLAQWVARKFADRVIIYLATLIRGFFSLKLLLQKRT